MLGMRPSLPQYHQLLNWSREVIDRQAHQS